MDPTTPSTKPAWLTTEFWLTVIPTVLFLIKAFTGHDVTGIDINGLALLAVSLLSAGYAISRAIVKKGVAQAQAMVTNQKLAIEHDERAQSLARAHEASVGRSSGMESYLTELDSRIAKLEGKAPAKTTARPRR